MYTHHNTYTILYNHIMLYHTYYIILYYSIVLLQRRRELDGDGDRQGPRRARHEIPLSTRESLI